MTKTYMAKGTCARKIDIEIEDGIIKHVEFYGGCSGNQQGIARLVEGKRPEEVIPVISGIKCGFKPTSCPDQLARALASMVE